MEVDCECENSSNSSATTYLNTTFTAFICVGAIALATVTIFNALIATMVLLSTSVALPVRVLLTNLLVANVISTVTVFICSLYTIALSLSDTIEPSLPFCRFIIWVYSVTRETGRLGLVAFSVTVVQIIVCATRQPGRKWLICSLVATWVIALIITVGIIVPPLSEVQYFAGVACFLGAGSPDTLAHRLAYLALWFAIGFSVALLTCICVPLATLCYIKRHTISEGPGAQYKKAMAKFATFLLAGNVLDLIGQAMMAVALSNIPDVVAVYLIYAFLPLSYIQAPILITAFLKPVHNQLRRVFCGKCLKKSGIIVMQPAADSNHAARTSLSMNCA